MDKVTFDHIEGVVAISRDLYAKSPEALQALLEELRSVGYEIDDQRASEWRTHDNVSVETMEHEGWSLWFAKLPDLHRAKCGSCGGYISTTGTQCHGHRCELCDEVIYLDVIDGSRIRFSFIDHDDRDQGIADLTMKAKRWDTEEGYLYLYPEVLDGLWLHGERAVQYLEANRDKWQDVEEGGQRLIRVRYPQPWDYDSSDINPSEISDHYWNSTSVMIWEGQEYPEWSHDLPVPESINIFEVWHWAPLDASPTLHRKLLGSIHNGDDKGWHYQDGRPWFKSHSFVEMGKFIREFTTLDADAWDARSLHFRLDGPGGIDDVAAFCHPDAIATDNPNIGNLLVGSGKVLSGEKLTDGDFIAMYRAVADRPTRDTFMEVVHAIDTSNRGPHRLARKLPRKLKKALAKSVNRRTAHEQNLVDEYRRRFNGVAA